MTPDTKGKVYLRSPNWDRGLPSLTSVSWNISVPSNQVACLTFLKERTGVVCQTGRAFMIIQEQRSKAEEIFSLEDEVLPKPSFHHHSFWVNISNCSPVSGKQLDLFFWVSLTPRTMGKGLQGLVGRWWWTANRQLKGRGQACEASQKTRLSAHVSVSVCIGHAI